MKIRILLAVLFSLAVIGLARADDIMVKGRDKAVKGTVTTEDAKGIVVTSATGGRRSSRRVRGLGRSVARAP